MADTTDTLSAIRAAGWAVAVHNDYRLQGEPHTFWLFTKGDRAVKGEGRTDAEALEEVRRQLDARPAPQPAPPGNVTAVLAGLIGYVERNECLHEDTYRGGTIWTICRFCGRKWADDQGGFQPYEPPPELVAAQNALAAARAAPPETAPPANVTEAAKRIAWAVYAAGLPTGADTTPQLERLWKCLGEMRRAGYLAAARSVTPPAGEALREAARPIVEAWAGYEEAMRARRVVMADHDKAYSMDISVGQMRALCVALKGGAA